MYSKLCSHLAYYSHNKMRNCHYHLVPWIQNYLVIYSNEGLYPSYFSHNISAIDASGFLQLSLIFDHLIIICIVQIHLKKQTK